MAKKRYRVGDHVTFKMLGRVETGVIKEDRGPLGIGGRQMYLIEIETAPEMPNRIELPFDEFAPAPATAKA